MDNCRFSRRWRDILSVLVIWGAIWAAYYPALKQIPLADHIEYLINTFGHYDTADIFGHTYSYPRTRIVAPGDTCLFRPVLFGLLAVQKGLFASQFAYQQAVGIGLHCLAALLLYSLLAWGSRRRIGDVGAAECAAGPPPRSEALEWMPAVLTLFFALNPMVAGLVNWAHLTGYLLFACLVVAAMGLLVPYALAPSPVRWRRVARVGGAWMLVLAAAFTYEMGQFFAVLAGLFLAAACWQRRQWRAGALGLGLFATILVLFQVANYVDMKMHAGQYEEDLSVGGVLGHAVSWDTVRHTGRFATFTFVQPFFPGAVDAPFAERTTITELDPWEMVRGPSAGAGLLVLGAWGVLGLPAVRLLLKKGHRRRLLAVLLAAGALVLYGAIIVLGRMNIRPWPAHLGFNCYYTYIALLLFVLMGGLLWPVLREGAGAAATPARKVAWAVLLVGLVVLSGQGGWAVHKINKRNAREVKGLHDLVGAVNAFVGRHRGEEGFSLAFDPADPNAVIWTMGVPVTTLYFRQYEDNYNPRYVLSYREGRLEVVPGREYRDLHAGEAQPLFRDLVAVHDKYHLYRFQGSYVGAIYFRSSQGVAAYERHGVSFTPPAPTADLAEQEARAMLARGVEPPHSGQPGREYYSPTAAMPSSADSTPGGDARTGSATR